MRLEVVIEELGDGMARVKWFIDGKYEPPIPTVREIEELKGLDVRNKQKVNI